MILITGFFTIVFLYGFALETHTHNRRERHDKQMEEKAFVKCHSDSFGFD